MLTIQTAWWGNRNRGLVSWSVWSEKPTVLTLATQGCICSELRASCSLSLRFQRHFFFCWRLFERLIMEQTWWSTFKSMRDKMPCDRNRDKMLKRLYLNTVGTAASKEGQLHIIVWKITHIVCVWFLKACRVRFSALLWQRRVLQTTSTFTAAGVSEWNYKFTRRASFKVTVETWWHNMAAHLQAHLLFIETQRAIISK